MNTLRKIQIVAMLLLLSTMSVQGDVFEDFLHLGGAGRTIDTSAANNETPQRIDGGAGTQFFWGGYTDTNNIDFGGSAFHIVRWDDGFVPESYIYTIFDAVNNPPTAPVTQQLGLIQVAMRNFSKATADVRFLVRRASDGKWFASPAQDFVPAGAGTTTYDLSGNWEEVITPAGFDTLAANDETTLSFAPVVGDATFLGIIPNRLIDGGGLYCEAGGAGGQFRVNSITWKDPVGLLDVDPSAVSLLATGGGQTPFSLVLTNIGVGNLTAVSPPTIGTESDAGAFTITGGGTVPVLAPGSSHTITLQFDDTVANLTAGVSSTAILSIDSDTGGAAGTITDINFAAAISTAYTWDNGALTSGTWGDNTQWTPNVVPLSHDTAEIISGTAIQNQNLIIGNGAIGTANALTALTISGGAIELASNRDLRLGENTANAGNVVMTGGSLLVRNLRPGQRSLALSSFSMSGGDLEVSNQLTPGNFGTGLFQISGGTANIEGIRLGNNGTAVGTLQIDGGTFNVNPTGASLGDGAIRLARLSTNHGHYIQTGGDAVVQGSMTLAEAPGSTATFSMSGGTLSVDSFITGNLSGTLPGNAAGVSFDWTSGTISTSGFDLSIDVLNTGGDLIVAGANNMASLVVDNDTTYTHTTGVIHMEVGDLFNNDSILVTSGSVILGAGVVIDVTFLNGGPNIDRDILLIDSVDGSIDVALVTVNLPATTSGNYVITRSNTQLILSVTGLGDPTHVNKGAWNILE